MDNFLFRILKDEELDNWYNAELSEAFISDERKPLADIRTLIEENKYDVWGLLDDESKLLGYATIWKKEGIDLLLIDYLGVSKDIRNMGLGAKILRLVGENYQGTSLVLESELEVDGDDPLENSIRTRRIGFYLRNGFIRAYKMATCGLLWQALVLGDIKDMAKLMKDHKDIYGSERTDVIVPFDGDNPPKAYWG